MPPPPPPPPKLLKKEKKKEEERTNLKVWFFTSEKGFSHSSKPLLSNIRNTVLSSSNFFNTVQKGHDFKKNGFFIFFPSILEFHGAEFFFFFFLMEMNFVELVFILSFDYLIYLL